MLSKLKKIRLKQIIYPSIITFFIVVVIVLLIFSVKFLSLNINKIFSLDTQTIDSQLLKVDIDKFYFVTNRLGIIIESKPLQEAAVTPVEEVAATPIEATTSKEIASFDKSLLKISVLNSTAENGLAKTLKAALEADGFLVKNTGNISPAQENTIIKIKESKKMYSPLIKKVVSQQYKLGEDMILEENSDYDAVIVIGEKQ